MSRLRPQFPWFKMVPLPTRDAVVADCGITTDKIADSAITAEKLADSISFPILDCGITTDKIADSAITAEKLADSISFPILDCGITTDKIADCAVTSIKIADSAVGNAEIADCSIGSSKIQDSGILTGDIADCAITSAKIGDSQVGSNEIADSSITTAKILDSAVTYAKIQNVTAQKLLGREDALAGSPQEIALSSELRFDTVNDWLEVADCGILVGLLKDSSITNVKIADSAISNDKIADCGVRSTELADSAVTSIKLSDSSVTAAKMSDSTLHTRIIDVHVTDGLVAVGDTAATFFVPAEFNGYDLVRAEACVKIADTTSRVTVQIRDVTGAADMLVKKITIDTGEKTSYTSDTASSVDTTNDTLVTGQEIAIDIDSATSAEDLHIILSVRKP